MHRSPIADREAGALRRIDKIVGARNLRYVGINGCKDDFVRSYHQGDCRGCALYLLREADLKGRAIDGCYTIGVAVCD
jgi:hypothetical protein